MISRITDEFWELFAELPLETQTLARRSYVMWRTDSLHPGLHFKPVKKGIPSVWSVRIGRHYRALGLREEIDGADTIIWYWVGPHAEYDRLLHNF